MDRVRKRWTHHGCDLGRWWLLHQRRIHVLMRSYWRRGAVCRSLSCGVVASKDTVLSTACVVPMITQPIPVTGTEVTLAVGCKQVWIPADVAPEVSIRCTKDVGKCSDELSVNAGYPLIFHHVHHRVWPIISMPPLPVGPVNAIPLRRERLGIEHLHSRRRAVGLQQHLQ